MNQRSRNFERQLWKNELEFNRRELAIFESFLLNMKREIHPDQLSRIMAELYQYCQLIDKMLSEIAEGNCEQVAEIERTKAIRKPEACKYLREEIFYFEQGYSLFRNRFCSMAEGLEAA